MCWPLKIDSNKCQITGSSSLLFRSLGTTPISGKTLSERKGQCILGALGEFRGILGATLGIRNSILGIRNSILGIASHDLSNTKTTILGATLGAIPGSDGNPHEIFAFAPPFSERFFKNWGGPRAQDLSSPKRALNFMSPNIPVAPSKQSPRFGVSNRRWSPRFVPISPAFFRFVFLVFLECADLFPFAPSCSVLRTNQNKLGRPLSADPLCKSLTNSRKDDQVFLNPWFAKPMFLQPRALTSVVVLK